MDEKVTRDDMINYLSELKDSLKEMSERVSITDERIADNENVDNEIFIFRFDMISTSLKEMLDYFVIDNEEE